MDEKIYTIPVTEGLKSEAACAFCHMKADLERRAIDFILGPSYMEEDFREQTDKSGFCPNCYDKLFTEQNRLGLALILHTHVQRINKELAERFDEVKKQGSKDGFMDGLKRKLGNKPKHDQTDHKNTCFICNRVVDTLERYVDTFFYMWQKMPEVPGLVQNGRGFCIEHLYMLMRSGQQKLTPKQYEAFVSTVASVQTSAMKKVEQDLDFFIKKFDYRYKDEPWGDAKEAVQNAIVRVWKG